MPIPTPPKLCTKTKCDKPAHISLITVKNEQGKELTGLSNKFGRSYVGRDQKSVFKLFSQYIFVEWVIRCAGCYTQDVERYKARQLPPSVYNNNPATHASKIAEHGEQY